MKPDPIAELPRTQRKALESAGYRVMRWMAARQVLQARVAKGRITGKLGDFLNHWLSLAPAPVAADDLWLSFDHSPDPMKLQLAGGSSTLSTSPLEHALLHLPALRSFWRQELRLRHFTALRLLVPQAWFLDPSTVPPGAIIAGLGTGSWEKASPHGDVQNLKGHLPADKTVALSARDSVWVPHKFSAVKLNATYGGNDKGQVVLRTVEAP